jgi:voltage-dependent anion channel protein 2
LISGDIETKFSDVKHGLTVTETWSTSNVLRSQVELDNIFAKGLKLDLNTALHPDKGQKTAIINAAYKQSGFHTRASLDFFKVREKFTSHPVLADRNALCRDQRSPPTP